jgi:hypothetical protein
MHVWIMECDDLSFITKVRLKPYAWMISEFPSQCPSHAIFMDFFKNIEEWLICLIKDEKQVVLKFLLMVLIIL